MDRDAELLSAFRCLLATLKPFPDFKCLGLGDLVIGLFLPRECERTELRKAASLSENAATFAARTRLRQMALGRSQQDVCAWSCARDRSRINNSCHVEQQNKHKPDKNENRDERFAL